MARFITVGDLSANTAIQALVQPILLEPFLDGVQLMYGLRLLAQAQFDALELVIDTVGLSGLTGSNLALINKLKPALCWATLYEALPFIAVKITNKGLITRESDGQSKAVDEDRFIKLRAEASKWMEFYIEEAKRFLRANKSIYTLWREEYFNNYELMSGATYTNGTTGYRSPIIFDRSLNHNNYYNYLKRFL